MIGDPLKFKRICNGVVLGRVLPTFAFRVVENAARRKWNFHGHVREVELLKLKKNGQFPDETVRITV